MVKIVDSNNNAQQNNTQTQDTAPLGGLGNETVKVQTAVPGTSTVSQFDNAFGIRNISTYAMHFTNLLDELKKSNE
ncbi:TPA: hypothetical protein NU463_004690, partial [Escherichia coli]|nr:hypothetical protein [Escherichia coli]